MRKLVILSASALVLALGAAQASAEPSTAQLLAAGQGFGQGATVNEGRAAAIDAPSANAVIWQLRHGR